MTVRHPVLEMGTQSVQTQTDRTRAAVRTVINSMKTSAQVCRTISIHYYNFKEKQPVKQYLLELQCYMLITFSRMGDPSFGFF